MNKKQKNISGYKLEQVPVVLTPTEVSLILQIEEKEVIKLIGNGVIKTIPCISELRIAAHSLFEFLHSEDEETRNSSGTGFVSATNKINSDSKVGFLSFGNDLRSQFND
tara:strand:- start:415 stop:741 length:327 start_codon:yes stop_codon:yes gene_type:complete